MNKTKALIITFEFPPYLGGAGVYAHDLALGLYENNCEVDIVTYEHNIKTKKLKDTFKTKYNINIFTFKPISILHFIQFPFLIFKTLKNSSYDLVVLSDSSAKKAVSLFGMFFNINYSKTICVFHGNEINSFFKQPSLAIRLTNLHKKFYRLLQKINKIITVSENEKRIWQKEFPQLSSKIRLIKHGVSESIFFKRNKEDIKKLKIKHGIPLNQTILFSASRIVKEKGQDVLLKAFKNVQLNHNNTLLLIAGEGPDLSFLKDLNKSLNIENHVIFLGALDRQTMSEYYAISDIFVLVSRFEEAFGLVYIEAAACGTASISGNSGGVKDIIDNKKNGMMINPEKTEELEINLNLLLTDKKKLNKLSENAYSNFKNNFTTKMSTKKLLNSL